MGDGTDTEPQVHVKLHIQSDNIASWAATRSQKVYSVASSNVVDFS